ncbi:FtsX-like permease family protein [Ornithinibacillus bavariensis]|uniref:FtsX-like permease family protein n=1 Tax=Ornithinibacillus bavariensis TaxID=545502 RepID=UPI000EB85586|nr:hypothetical protein [Ornithinibacillus sp.]
MTFNKIVWKMAKHHYKKYIFYLVCNSLAVTFFFMFTTVYLNKQLVEMEQSEGIQYVLSIPGVALIIFTIFFISYAHHIFMKKRRSEFGLFMTLGMTRREISKLIVLENSIIALISLIIGVLIGATLSRFFFWLLLKFVGIQEILFQLHAKMFLYTVIVFLVMFFVAVGQSLYLTLKRNIITNLKNEKITENVSDKHARLGGIGLLIVVGSIIGLYFTYTGQRGGNFLLLWSLATFIGLYIVLYHFTSLLIELIKKNKGYYYRRLLYLTNINYKYKRLTSVMMLVTVMIMVTLLYSTIILFTYITTEREAIEETPFDVAFIQTDSTNNVGIDALNAIFEQNGNRVQRHVSVPIYSYFQKDYYEVVHAYTFMSLDAFNELTSSQFELKNNEFIYFLNENTETPDSIAYDQGLRIPSGSDEIVYDVKEVIVEKRLNTLSNLSEIFVINDTELSRLKRSIDGLAAVVHLINLEDWQDSKTGVEKLKQTFESFNISMPAINVEHIVPEDELFQISSRIEGYEMNKNSNGILFFVTIFLSVLFFIGSFFLLYIQLFSEVDKELERIRKLYRIGITSKEIKRIISQEITTIFMIPTLLGTTLALLYILAMATDIGGVIANPEIILHFLIVGGSYFVIQFAFLFYARKKMYRLLSTKLAHSIDKANI